MRYKIVIEYDGTMYHGWQKQSHCKTVAGQIEKALKKITSKDIEVFGSGRTDTGVHALGQVAHFDLEKEWDDYKLKSALNSQLKNDDIAIINVEKVSDDFHARFSSKKRYYEYIILNRPDKVALGKNHVWHIVPELDVDAMKKAAGYFKGQHDFSSFRASSCTASTPVKTMNYVKVKRKGQYIYINVKAKSFLHHQVRNMVGALVDVGLGKKKPEYIEYLLQIKDRTKGSVTAPADGLYFIKVDY